MPARYGSVNGGGSSYCGFGEIDSTCGFADRREREREW